jgi:Aspartyl/Asparaginyl beta-hydroxylase
MRAAFHDLKEFPALLDLAHAWPKIRQDFDALVAPLMDIDRVGKSYERVAAEVTERVEAGEPFGWVRGWGRVGGNPDWTQYGLVLRDRSIGYASAPRTLALLGPLRGIKVAAFVRLAPGTLLPLHTHPEVAAEDLLQMHITLKASKPSASCLLNVAGEIRQHVTGGTLVFDGSLPHWAVNASTEDRVILYLEFHRATHHRPRLAASSSTIET